MHRNPDVPAVLGRAILFGLCLARPAPAGAPDRPPAAEYSAEGLRAGILEAQRSIKGLRVAYRSYDYDPRRYPRGSYSHRIVAARSPGDLYHVSAHGHDRLDWRDDPFQQRATISGQHLYNEFYINRVFFDYDVRPEDGLPGSLSSEFFFLATGIWPLEGLRPPRPDGRAFVLREVAASPDYSAVRPEQEMVGGRWCHVLEYPGYDRLWLDAGRGFALLARETHSVRTGALVQRVELGGHREVSRGIWMPRTMRNIQYDHNARTEEGRRRVYLDATHDVTEVEVNDQVDSRLFAFHPRPGSMRTDPGKPLVQVRPGGLDHLDDLARLIRGDGPAPPVGGRSPVGVQVAIGTVLVIAVCEFCRRRVGRPLGAPA
jgi:hypothetical protein